MPRLYIATSATPKVHVAFVGNSGTYTAAVKAACGILDDPPAGSYQDRGAAVKSPAIVPLRAKLANGKRARFMCGAVDVSDAMTELLGVACAGSTIEEVGVPRKQSLR